MIGTDELLNSHMYLRVHNLESQQMILVVNLLIWNSDESQCFDVIFQQFIGLGSPNLCR